MRNIFNFRNYKFRYYDVKLILLILILSIVGILVINSATINSVIPATKKQVMGVCLGFACMIFISMIDYHWVLKLYPLIYIGSVGMLFAVLAFGTNSSTGAQRWLELPVIGQIQPAEFTKIFLILFFAKFFDMFSEKINSPAVVGGSLALIGVPLFMIFKQPNLSTTLVTTVVFLALLYTAKISYRWILGAFTALVPLLIALFFFIQSEGEKWLAGISVPHYQVKRVLAWLAPEKYDSLVSGLLLQQKNSVMAIGSGQLDGKGLNTASLESVKNGNFLMEQDCDFIFAVIGEELGFRGSCFVIALIVLVALECLLLAGRAKDLQGKLICTGMGVLIGFQSFVNIGVATQILPNTGIPLPFVSAGLSSLLSIFIGMGFVLNVSLQRRTEKL